MTVTLVLAPFEEYELPDDFFDSLLTEAKKRGKGLHSLLVKDEIRQAVIDAGFDANQGKFRAARSAASTRASKEFESLWQDLAKEISSVTQMYLRSKNPKSKARRISTEEWKQHVRGALRRGYYTAFEQGLKSSGAGKFRVTVSQADTAYIEAAIKQELVYFNKLLRQIDADNYSGRLHDRLRAYAEALKHVYYAGRVMGTPSGMIIDWIAPMDRNTCRGCRFLFDNSPYTKKTLPTTPRAGDTPCLNRCRCRLVMRTVSAEDYTKLEKKQPRKSWYAARLSAIKSGRSLS